MHRVSAVMERPFSARTEHLPAYQIVLALPQAIEVRADACQFGSIHQKSFALLGVNVDLKLLALRCQGACTHVPVAGVYTKASAIYTPQLAFGLAWVFKHAIHTNSNSDPVLSLQKTEGLENQLVNEIMIGSYWSIENSWRFKRSQHINLLELKSIERLVEKAAKKRPQRLACLVDSNVSVSVPGEENCSLHGLLRHLPRHPLLPYSTECCR